MRVLRAALLGILVAVVCSPARANAPAEDVGVVESLGSRLIGVWKLSKSADLAPGASALIEFTRGGDVKVSLKLAGTALTFKGTYTVAGNKLKVGMIGPDGKEKKETMTIKELTNRRLVTIDARGKAYEFQRK